MPKSFLMRSTSENIGNYMKTLDIDLVYLWVDGSDAGLMNKNKFLGIESDSGDEATTKARAADNGELKYSLRSMEKNAPWIRKIFIVTDEQTLSGWIFKMRK